MFGIYINEIESKLLIPLLIKKIDDIFCLSALTPKDTFNQLEDLAVYQEILGRIYAAQKIGCLNTDIYGD